MTDFKPNVFHVSKAEDPEAWLAKRREGIGGSDVAAIFGLNPWKGPLAVWLEKKGQTPEREATERMEIGEWMEDSIAQLFAKRTGYVVKPCNVILQHPKHTFMLASVDRWVEDETGEEGVLEVKNIGEYMAEDWEDGKVPDYYGLQVHHYLAVSGKRYAWIAPLIGGNRLKPIRIARDDRLIDELIEGERKFWQLVESNTPPAIDDSKEAETVLRLIHPASTAGKSITLEGEQQAIYKKMLMARTAFKQIEQEIQGYKNLLMEKMGDAEAAYIPGQEKPVITFKGMLTRRFDAVRYAAEHPVEAAPYYNESSTRRFLVKGEEE